MQYLLIDAHKRFLGTFNSSQSFAVGDTFESPDNQIYAVVGVNWSVQHTLKTKSLTVIPVGSNSRNSDQN
jgi:hypothetical protein